MYSHHLQDMARLLDEKGLLKGGQEKAVEILRTYWEDKIAITWSARDIIDKGKEMDVDIPSDRANEILRDVLSSHDCNYGITWDTISCEIDSYKEQAENEKVEKTPKDDLPTLIDSLEHDSSKAIFQRRLKENK